MRDTKQDTWKKEGLRHRLENAMKKGRENIPLSFTVMRVVLVPILFGVILYQKPLTAVAFYLLIGLAAFIDGFLTRRRAEDSRLRIVLDMTADRLFIDVAVIAFLVKGTLPLWVALVFLGRDGIATVWSIVSLRNQERSFRQSGIASVGVFFQIVAFLPLFFGALDWILMGAALVLSVFSLFTLIAGFEFRKVPKEDLIPDIHFDQLLQLPDVFTLGNAILGLVAIFLIVKQQFQVAAVLILSATVLDYLDGKLARRLKRENGFGKELDSLADTVSFGVAPALFGFNLIATPLAVASFSLFLFAGILRLARYNIMTPNTESFRGMPITVNGIVIPALYFLGLEPMYYPYVFLLLGALMVSPISVKKLK